MAGSCWVEYLGGGGRELGPRASDDNLVSHDVNNDDIIDMHRMNAQLIVTNRRFPDLRI